MGNLLKLLILLCVLGFGTHYWREYKAKTALVEQTSDTGFVHAVVVDRSAQHAVLVLAPENCPSEEAQRSYALTEKLTRMGIPVVTGSSFNIEIDNPTEEQQAGIERAVAVFKQGAPAVYVNDMAKSNPSAEEVAREYKRAKANHFN